ncbi:MAG: hypothetical protein ACK5X3_12925 [Pseudomonadota bacterium]|jgi:hypothetical protein
MTDTNNGWPGKPGVPLNPEKDGPHRLRHHDSDLVLDALWSCGGTWLDLSGNFSIPHAAAFYDYLGPCLTPDEATALQARADQAAQGHAREADRAEITRLRAAINNALLEPWLDGQLNGTWHQEPIGPNETPEEAVKRLVSVRAEWAVYKNNCENPEIAELRAALATARREGMEEAAQVLEELHRNHKYNPKTGEGREHDVGYYRAISEGVAHILYAAKEDRNP